MTALAMPPFSPAITRRRETPFARLSKSIRPTQWPPDARTCVTVFWLSIRRSPEILRYVTAQLAACAGPESSLPTPSKDALAAARAYLARKRAPASFSDAAEANSALAGKLWEQRNASCAAPPADDPMRLVMSILAAR